jgi:DNA-binding CsgD family transcriptional regulator
VQGQVPRPDRSRRSSGAGSDRTTAASFGLSPRELGVLAEVIAGRTNREIGERLFISEKTVGVHVGNILAKLGVGGRVEAATVALRLGLVDDVPQRAKKPGPGGPGFGSRRRGGAA